MKSLANSSAFAIVDKLGYKPSVIYASDHRPKSVISLPCRKATGNLRFVKLEQNKDNLPVRASETKVNLDAADHTTHLLAQQKDESKFVRVKFQLQRKCKFGEQFFVVGDDPTFGSWDPSDAKPMAWSDGHIWTAEMDIEAGKTIQFKFILKGRKGNITWQPGSDRFIKTWESVNGITVCEDWENAELQKIIEEEQQQHSNEESHMEKPLISSSSKSTSGRRKVIKNTNPKNADPTDNRTQDGPNGIVASIKNQERKVVAERNLLDFEDGPVLVPGLAPSVVSDEESDSVEEI